ncbi:SusD-like starch-binding protein associating with outer membrane [Pontibacter ummariensis]|uniref:SusD family protein n=1 Tax=Pontibacter ummariensis TaxID=1610492 RepID=A0A239KJ28_9BACT|nr:RagB/SusD family nutrient uptake outer membrane protein [Pontibacter ummariensis]PRY05735.1 SusD-like starch-binding protein associating with outer membrane [Pontibacter ummariensis]SNT17718.1 SusD family protein [Pontibacter ummariensis]
MKIQRIVLSIGLCCALGLTACEKVIEVEPEFAKDGSEIFTSLNDYEFALTGAYASFRQVGYLGSGGQTTGTWSALPDMMSDNLVQTSEDLGNWSDQTNWVYTSDDSDLAVAWLAAYSVVTQANLVLRNIEQFSEASPERVNRLKGQALAIRAMVHFDLLRYWGESLDRNSTALGVPYKTIVDAEDMPKRLSVKETYDNIFKDLKEAETLLGDVDTDINASNRAYIDQTVTRAILARVSLYAKDYVAAKDYATLVIEEMPLAGREDFANIWTDASEEEVIWSVAFSAGEGTAASGVHNAPSNRNRFKPSAELMATYDAAKDVRYASYFGTRTLSDTERTIVKKFLSRGTAMDNLVNWKVFRTGEMYLIRAEARALSGDALGALADLNTLRAARIEGYLPVVLAGQPLLDAIALERRKELFAEGHRWFDLKRTTRNLQRVDCGSTATNCTLASGAREWAWPVPQAEIDANVNISSQQTAGY